MVIIITNKGEEGNHWFVFSYQGPADYYLLLILLLLLYIYYSIVY